MMRLAAALLLSLFASAVHAQEPPYVYMATLGPSSMQVLPNNPARKRVVFINPNESASIAVCPAGPTRSAPSVPVVAAINGPA
jgi:hypothetical protein